MYMVKVLKFSVIDSCVWKYVKNFVVLATKPLTEANK